MASNTLRFPTRFRGTGADNGKETQTSESKDLIVQQTDQDASHSRLSAVETGYLVDPFARAFVDGPVQKKFPLINRGTYVRTTSIDNLVTRFIASTPNSKQIISLGAGSDTRYFRLLSGPLRDSLQNLVYHELDFSAVTARKIRVLGRGDSAARSLLLSEPSLTEDALVSQHYRIHPIDLRSLHPGCPMLDGMDISLPTLVISECCLIYLAPTEADAIIKWITGSFRVDVGIILYEPIGGEDAFGRVMVRNLASRGIVLRTLEKYSTLGRQRERLRVLGMSGGQEAASVEWLFEGVEEAERARISGLEMLDEVEEWNLLAGHYCVVWGWRGEGIGRGWEGVVVGMKGRAVEL